MINHSDLRSAVKTVLQADAPVFAAIDRAGWYTLSIPKAVRSPAICVGAISQPLVGITGTNRRNTRFSDPITVNILVLCEKHNPEEADALLGEVAEKVYTALVATRDLGIAGIHTSVEQVSTGAYPKLGLNVVGAEFVLQCMMD